MHYLKPLYYRDPQTREFFIQDTFLAEINISKEKITFTHVETPEVHFLDPYIISVEDKTRIIVYSSVDPDKYFIYDLELRKVKNLMTLRLDFELFVELGC